MTIFKIKQKYDTAVAVILVRFPNPLAIGSDICVSWAKWSMPWHLRQCQCYKLYHYAQSPIIDDLGVISFFVTLHKNLFIIGNQCTNVTLPYKFHSTSIMSAKQNAFFKTISTNCCYSNDPIFYLPFNFLLLGRLCCNSNLAWTRNWNRLQNGLLVCFQVSDKV